jgi:ubiquinone biosynthesis protein
MFSIPKRFAGIKRFEHILRVINKYELEYYLEKAHLKTRSLFSKKGMARPTELRMMFEELGGSFVKLGQLLSLRPDLIPKEYCDEFSKLQDHVKPFSFEEVEHVIKAELKQPIKKLFKSFDKKPLASASIGQVHAAYLKNNKKVAVKVMRPGIKSLMETDLELIDFLARQFKHHVHQNIVDPEEISEEFKRYTENELDYLKEAYHIKKFYDNFKGDKKVKVPLVYDKLTTHRVLTMEFIEGVELRKILDDPKHGGGIDTKKISELVASSVMKQIFVDGFFHGDPHPGNILVNKDTIGFIDFGIVGRIDDEMKEKLGLLFVSLINRDINGLVKALISLNMVDTDVDAYGLKNDLSESLGEYYDTTIDRMDIGDIFFKCIKVASKHHIRVPRDFVLLGKALITLQGVNMALNPDFNLVRATQPFINKLAKEKSKPSHLLRRIAKETERFAEFVNSLPDESQRMYRTVEKADVALDSINNDLQGLTREIRIEGWRIIMGLIVAALVVGASLIYNTDVWVSTVFIGIACLILAYLLFSIFRDSVKSRRH